MNGKAKKVSRRQAILTIGGAGAALGFGCGGSSPTSPEATPTTTTTPTTGSSACAVTPSETAGPFPSLTDPESVNAAVYATGVYASRGSNPTANARDGIFADSLDSEVASVSGDATNGYTATFRVGIAA